MHDSNEWVVTLVSGRDVKVTADRWETPHGDLVFINNGGTYPFLLRAFARDTWREVRLYA